MNGFKRKQNLIQAAFLCGLGVFVGTFSMLASEASRAALPQASFGDASPMQLSCNAPHFLARSIFSAEFVNRLEGDAALVEQAKKHFGSISLRQASWDSMLPVEKVESLITCFMRSLLACVEKVEIRKGGYSLNHLVDHLALTVAVVPQIDITAANYLPYFLVNALDQVECEFDASTFYGLLCQVDVVKIEQALRREVCTNNIQELMLLYHCAHIKTCQDIVNEGLASHVANDNLPGYVQKWLKNGCW